MVSYTDFEVDAQERVALIDVVMRANKDEYHNTPIDQHPTFQKVTKRLYGLKMQRDRLSYSIEENPVKYKVDQLKKVEGEIEFIIEMLDFTNQQVKLLAAQRESYRVGITAFVKGSELLNRLGFLQEWAMSNVDENIALTEMCISLLEKRKEDGLPDPKQLKDFSDKLREQSKLLFNLVVRNIKKLTDEPN